MNVITLNRHIIMAILIYYELNITDSEALTCAHCRMRVRLFAPQIVVYMKLQSLKLDKKD